MGHLGWSNSEYTINPQATRFLHVSTTVFYADAVNEEEVLEHTEEALENYKYILELNGGRSHHWRRMDLSFAHMEA